MTIKTDFLVLFSTFFSNGMYTNGEENKRLNKKIETEYHRYQSKETENEFHPVHLVCKREKIKMAIFQLKKNKRRLVG